MTAPESSCYRCGQQGEPGETFTIRLADGTVCVNHLGDDQCTTLGCAEPDGSRRLTPPSAEEMRRREEDAWLARHREMASSRT